MNINLTRSAVVPALTFALLLALIFGLMSASSAVTGSPARTAATGDRSGVDWTQPIPARLHATRPNCAGIRPNGPCERFDRYDRLQRAFYLPGSRGSAIAVGFGLTGGYGAGVLGYTPAWIAARAANPSASPCNRAVFHAVDHLFLETYLFDASVFATKRWAVPLLESVSSVKVTAAGQRAYDLMRAQGKNASQASAAKAAVNSLGFQPYTTVLRAGLGVTQGRVHNLLLLKFGQTVARACR